MEISSKGWNSIRPAKKERGQGGKRAPKWYFLWFFWSVDLLPF
jgi:hypothetical protein